MCLVKNPNPSKLEIRDGLIPKRLSLDTNYRQVFKSTTMITQLSYAFECYNISKPYVMMTLNNKRNIWRQKNVGLLLRCCQSGFVEAC